MDVFLSPSTDVLIRIRSVFNAVTRKGPKITGIQFWLSVLSFELSSLQILLLFYSIIFWTIHDGIFKVFPTLVGKPFFNCLTVWNFLRLVNLFPFLLLRFSYSKTPFKYLKSCYQLTWMITKCSSRCFVTIPLALTAFCCHRPNIFMMHCCHKLHLNKKKI